MFKFLIVLVVVAFVACYAILALLKKDIYVSDFHLQIPFFKLQFKTKTKDVDPSKSSTSRKKDKHK